METHGWVTRVTHTGELNKDYFCRTIQWDAIVAAAEAVKEVAGEFEVTVNQGMVVVVMTRRVEGSAGDLQYTALSTFNKEAVCKIRRRLAGRPLMSPFKAKSTPQPCWNMRNRHCPALIVPTVFVTYM